MIRAATALAFALTVGCATAAGITMVDDAGREVRLPSGPAERIVSLAPHITENLFAAGAGHRVVGVIAYSDFPEAANRLPRVGSHNNADLEAIIALKPDLVIAWDSGNRSANLDRLIALGVPVFFNDSHTFDDVARSLEVFGKLAGTEDAANEAAAAFRARLQSLVSRYGDRPTVRTFYQIWHAPLMTVNGEHLISDAIRLCGGENVFAALPQLSPTVGVEGILAANPEVIVASGMDASRPEWLEQWRSWPGLTAVARDNLYFVPPDQLQRHTPRILDGTEHLCRHLERAREKRPPATDRDVPG